MAKNRYTRRKLLKYDMGGYFNTGLEQFAESGMSNNSYGLLNNLDNTTANIDISTLSNIEAKYQSPVTQPVATSNIGTGFRSKENTNRNVGAIANQPAFNQATFGKSSGDSLGLPDEASELEALGDMPDFAAGLSDTNRGSSIAGRGFGIAASAVGGLTNQTVGATYAGQDGLEGTVDNLIGSVPIIGEVYSLVNTFGEALTSPSKEINTDVNNPVSYGKIADEQQYTDMSNLGWVVDPIGNLITGLEGNGWSAEDRLASLNEEYAPQREAMLKQRNANIWSHEKSRNPGNFRDTQTMAAYGGRLPQLENGGFTDYQTGQKHGQSSMDGIPVDSIGNPSANSGRPATGLTEKNEVSYNGYIFSDQLYV